MATPYLNKNQETNKNRVTQNFKTQFPDLYQAVHSEGFEAGQASVDFKIDPKTMENLGTIVPIQPASESKPIDRKMSIEEQAKIAWDNDHVLRAEFNGDYEAYLAGEKAMSAGCVKILGNWRG